ncbi:MULTISPECIES: hypothetical protein [Rhizobium]|uniref:Uncharacterized protein n=1 Tax=Rhizobium aouanii TaxID=3118145 RepID=A0ABU8CJA3_9HYPH|nr:hypothetical protein [Rhizobium acaciae]MCW1410739.1 hypothetical protein [Rhizobium acaciae]MCW1742962.1 hypothetical protein [Rhizobium acaciae]MCW1750158.1 hypothetical protein [Rhizobium acaciae]
MIRALVALGISTEMKLHRKGAREMYSPWANRMIDAYVFGRSYQERERGQRGSVEAALDANDPDWRTRELIIMPSHVASVDHPDILDMIDLAHSAGFDVVAASVIFSWDGGDNRADFPNIWRMPWDERWTIPNPWTEDNLQDQLEMLGRELWTRICKKQTP